MNEIHTAYAALGIEPGETIETIRDRYRTLAMVWHPDRLHNNPFKDKAEPELAKINIAKEILEKHFKHEHQEGISCRCKPEVLAEVNQDQPAQRQERRSRSDEDALEEARKLAAQTQAQAEWEQKLREDEEKRWGLSKKAGMVFLAFFVFSFLVTTVKSLFGFN